MLDICASWNQPINLFSRLEFCLCFTRFMPTMIYMPSLMKPIKESVSETTSCNMLAASSSELHRQMCSCLNTSESAVGSASLKPVPSDIRHPFYRHPAHRHHRHQQRVKPGLQERPKTVVPQLTVNSEIAPPIDSLRHWNRMEKQMSLPGTYPLDQNYVDIADDSDLVQFHSRENTVTRRSWSPVEWSDQDRPQSSNIRSTPCLNLAFEPGQTDIHDSIPVPKTQQSSQEPCWSGTRNIQAEVADENSKSGMPALDPEAQIDACDQLHNLTNRLLYFPNISSKLKIQFAGNTRTAGGSTRTLSTHQSDEIIPKLEHDTNLLSIMDKPLIGSLMPFISTRNQSIYSERVQVLVERKGQRTSADNTQTKVLQKRRQTIAPTGKQTNSGADPIRRTRLKSLSAWRAKQGSRIRRACGLNSRITDLPLLLSGEPNRIDGSTISLNQNSELISSLNDSEDACQECQRVVLNVSGLKFETWLAVLNNHPTTLLGDAEKRMQFYDSKRKEYFFDRHRPSFEAIFNYYQYGGRLKRPAVVADDVFLRELEFFQIEEDALESYKKHEGYVPEVIILPENQFKRKLWLLFEYPETSPLAFCFSVTSVIFTIISIILFCVETLPVYAQTHCEPGAKPNFRDPFFIIETICTIWFTFELIIRFSSCPSHKAFIKDFKNLIDLAAIVPYYITLVNVLITFSCEGAKSSASLAFLRVIRLIRVFKLTKHSSGLQILVLTFKESIEGLSLFLVAFIVCILVFSSTLYYVEIDRKGSQIESIPDAFWWAVITMCTVGYGDKVPKGPLGKIVGSVCAVAGVLTLAIPVPIITENFNKFYAHKTGRGRR
ncbi:unnamed protein product [Echinostoma caproni]|uniref:BTB domain-containing protein n=1 Tax=Echinostoma caproni TaxID=27848 RepID=A0A183A880_9TREM|nr:unnamed protein product [Echinostoma caproni]